MACYPKGCNCTFQSETLAITVAGGVVTIEQAELTDITELEDDVAALQAALAALTTTVTDGLAAQTAALAAGIASREPVRHTGTPVSVATGTTETVIHTVSVAAVPYARFCQANHNCLISKTVNSDVIEVRSRYNGTAIIITRHHDQQQDTSVGVWCGIIPANTAATFTVTALRASGTGTWSSQGAGVSNRFEVSTWRLS